jgi:two-component system cell cycle sensor histidine kinase/response regulator CckA
LPASGKKIPKTVNQSNPIIEGSGNILIVDDEELVLKASVQMLRKLGYTTIETGGGKEAIEIYKNNKDHVDLVILDMIMPEIGGGEAYDKMKEINPEVKVLLSSGYSIDGKASDILKRGCNGFIQKPFSMKELSEKITEIIEI